MHIPHRQDQAMLPHDDSGVVDQESDLIDLNAEFEKYINMDQLENAVVDNEASGGGYQIDPNRISEFSDLEPILPPDTGYEQYDSCPGGAMVENVECTSVALLLAQSGFAEENLPSLASADFHESLILGMEQYSNGHEQTDNLDVASANVEAAGSQEQAILNTNLDTATLARTRRLHFETSLKPLPRARRRFSWSSRRRSDASVSGLTSSGGRPRRASIGSPSTGKAKRSRPLTLEESTNATYLRLNEFTCLSCIIRKIKCDAHILCASCIRLYGPEALEGSVTIRSRGVTSPLSHPCVKKSDIESGKDPKVVETLVSRLLPLGHHCFPSPQSDPFYFGEALLRIGRRFDIELSMGFGPMWAVEVEQVRQIVSCDDNYEYWYHRHHKTSWPWSHTARILDNVEIDPILPVVFASTYGLKEKLLTHFTLLMKLHWKQFPKYNSPLDLLDSIHKMYLYLLQDEQASSQAYVRVLEDALVMLVMVHVAGDLSLNLKHENVQSLMMLVFGGVLKQNVACCFLRAQVGAAISSLVRDLMTRIVSSVLLMTLRKQCKDFPIVFATLYIIFATIDSLLYHGAKVPLHEFYPDANHQNSVQEQELHIPESIKKGAEDLAYIYSKCYPNCHAVHVLGKEDKRPWKNRTHHEVRSPGIIRFLEKLPKARELAQSYLDERSSCAIKEMADVTLLLDHFAAKFVLLTVIPQENAPVV